MIGGRQSLLRAATLASGVAVAVCVAILLADAAVARIRAPREDSSILALQKQVKEDASLAPKLASEQKRITAARLSRKYRDNGVSYALIVASAAFLTCLKRLLASRSGGVRPSPEKTSPTAVPRFQGHRPISSPPRPPELDLTFIDQIVARLGRQKEGSIPALQAIQAHYRYLPDEALKRLCQLTEITPSQIAGVASFYKAFRHNPTGKHIIRVCHGTACHVAGARQVTEDLHRYLEIPPGADTDPHRIFTLEEVACLGCCSLAPVLMVNGTVTGRITPAGACRALHPFEQEPAS